jgi:hypothetical protein
MLVVVASLMSTAILTSAAFLYKMSLDSEPQTTTADKRGSRFVRVVAMLRSLR